MNTIQIGQYEVQIFNTADGDEFFISQNGNTVYSALTNRGNAENQASWIIGSWSK